MPSSEVADEPPTLTKEEPALAAAQVLADFFLQDLSFSG